MGESSPAGLLAIFVILVRSGLDKQTRRPVGAGEAQNKKRKRNLVDRMSGKLRSREIALLREETRGREDEEGRQERKGMESEVTK